MMGTKITAAQNITVSVRWLEAASHNVRLLFGFVFGGITPLATGSLRLVAANVLAVVVFLYLMQGLAVFRFMLVKAGAGVVGTIFGFILLGLLCVTGLGLFLLAIAGLFDPFFDFRKLKRKDDSHESHTD